MGEAGMAGGVDLQYDYLTRDLWPGMDDLLTPLTRAADALLSDQQPASDGQHHQLDPHLLLDGPFGDGCPAAIAGGCGVATTAGGCRDPLDLAFSPPSLSQCTGGVQLEQLSWQPGRLLLRLRPPEQQPLSNRLMCQLCGQSCDMFQCHEHAVQGRLSLAGSCVVLEIGLLAEVVSEQLQPMTASLPLSPQLPRTLQPSKHEPPVSISSGEPPLGSPVETGSVLPDDGPDIPDRTAPADGESVSGSNAFRCPDCDKSFSSQRVLNKHMLNHAEAQHACDSCGRRFHRRDRLLRHQLSHTDSRPHVCSVCQKGFYRREYLQQHERMHTGEQPFQCHVCGKQFSILSNLTLHRRVHDVQRRHSCHVCGQGFNRATHLQTHITSQHSDTKAFICDKCGKGFSASEKLRRHMLTHTDQRPFVCSVCQKSFNRKDKHDEHVSTHEQGHHPCTLCSKTFGNAQLLAKHAKNHADPLKVQCPTCCKFFASAEKCTAHAVRHLTSTAPTSGTAPLHRCHCCVKVFRRAGSLRSHLLKQHAGAEVGGETTAVQCGQCGRRFCTAQTLRAHMRRVHGDHTPAGSASTAAAGGLQQMAVGAPAADVPPAVPPMLLPVSVGQLPGSSGTPDFSADGTASSGCTIPDPHSFILTYQHPCTL